MVEQPCPLRQALAEIKAGISALKVDGLFVPIEFHKAHRHVYHAIEDAGQAWRPIETAPKDGTWIISRCNDHSRLYYMRWGVDHDGYLNWCTKTASYGDGLFSKGGQWIPAPQPGPVAFAASKRDGLSRAIAETERDHPLPRCSHGSALRDGSGEALDPPCGCRAALPCTDGEDGK